MINIHPYLNKGGKQAENAQALKKTVHENNMCAKKFR